MPQGPLHVMSSTIQFSGRPTGRLMLVHDMSFVHQRSTDTKWYVFYLFTGLAALISLVTVLVAHISWRGWIAGVRALLDRGGLPALRRKIHSPELHPVAHDLNELVRELEADRRMRDESQITWSPASLKTILHEHLSGDEILIVSNREPYIHTKRGQKIDVQLPASGLISALEPVMRACSGVWIAHGSGSADREVVDSRDHVRVPPDHPSYDIRRIWITPDEEAGYLLRICQRGVVASLP